MKATAGGMAAGRLHGVNPGEGPNRPPPALGLRVPKQIINHLRNHASVQ